MKNKRATELEYLRWFVQNADFGPADGDIRDMMRERFEQMIDSDVRLTQQAELGEALDFAGAPKFDLDPCAARELRKQLGLPPIADVEWDIEDDGLSRDWFGRVFVNPPFSDIMPWVEKAEREIKRDSVSTITFLVPANRTEQPWFQRVQDLQWDMRFLPKRRSFIYPDGSVKKSPPFGVVLLGVAE